MGRLYDAYIEVGPRFAGTGDIKKEGDRAGKEYGKALAEAAAKAAQANIRRLGEALGKARSSEADAVGKVRVAEAKLAEVRARSNVKASQVAAAEESLAAAQRRSAAASDTAKNASEALNKARDRVAKSADSAGKTSGSRFSNAFKGAMSKIGGEKEGKDVATRFGVGMNGAIGSIVSRSAGIFVAGFAAVKGAQIFSGFIADAEESAKVSRITANAIRATGGAANVTADQVGDLATAISNKTGIDDEQVQTASNMLLTFKKIRNQTGANNDIFNRATQAAADLSVQFGGIDGASKQLGKALNDPVKGITALSKAGVTFTEQQKKQIKEMVKSGDVLGAQKIILKEIEGQVGGAAEAAGSPLTKLKVIAGNLAEQFGGYLLPAVSKFAGFLGQTVAPAVSGLADLIIKGDFSGNLRKAFNIEEDSGFVDFILTAREKIGSFFTEVKDGIVAFAAAWKYNDGEITSSGFPGFMERVGYVAHQAFDFFKAEVLPRLREFAGFLVGSVIPALGKTAEFIGRNRDFFVPFAATILAVVAGLKIWAAVQAVLNVVLAANPIGLVVIAIAALVAGLIYAYKNSETFRKIVNAVFTAVRDVAVGAFKTVVGAVSGAIGWIKSNWPLLLGILTGPFGLAVVLIARNWDSIKSTAQSALRFVVLRVLDFAGSVLGAAAKAFSWVPGLGDKLKGAQAAFATFRDDVNRKLGGIQDQNINFEIQYSAKGVNLTAPSSVGRRHSGGPGGPVDGPGTTTSDQAGLFALSRKEWVIRAKSSMKYGDHAMASVNAGTATIIPGAVRGFASGGRPGLTIGRPNPPTDAFVDSVAATAKRLVTPVAEAALKKALSTNPGGPPGARQSFRGVTLNERTIRMLLNAERILGAAFHITQGSYSTRVAASGSTHAGGGAMDTNGPRGWDIAVRALRAAGFAAWHRTPSQGPWNHHIHSIALGDSSASPSAKAQMASFRRGGNGLGGMAAGGKVGLFDRGGKWPSGTMGVNLSGKTETVRTAEQERSLQRGQVGLLTITNWQDGTGHFRLIARDEIGSESEFNNAVGRMHR